MNSDQFLEIAQREISNDPKSRLHGDMISALENSRVLFDVHAHAFNWRDIPRRFLQFRVLDRLGLVNHVFNHWKKGTTLRPIIKGGVLRLIEQLGKERESGIVELMNAYQNSGYHAVFSLLQMDMRGISGKKEDTFETYLQTQLEMVDKFPSNLLFFYACDPNNPALYQQFLDVFTSGQKGCFGVKVYPSLGYLPSHPRLMPIFKICEEKNIPVTVHCSSAKTRSSDRSIKIKGIDFKTGLNINETKSFTAFEKPYKRFFNRPHNWIPVLERFPRLRLNLAHFGGDSQLDNYFKRQKEVLQNPSLRENFNNWQRNYSWVACIMQFLNRYPNVYADISYALFTKKLTPQLFSFLEENPVIAKKVMYGSDFPLSQSKANFSDHWRQLVQDYSSNGSWSGLVRNNPAKFLQLDSFLD